MKQGVAMVLCRSMAPVFSEDEFTARSVAANLFYLKLNETLHLALHSNFALFYSWKIQSLNTTPLLSLKNLNLLLLKDCPN